MNPTHFKPLALALASLACIGSAHADFSGAYAPANWSLTNSNGGNGSVLATASTLTLTSSDLTGQAVDLTPSLLSYDIAVAGDSAISFHWSYATTDDSSSYDTFSYVVNGVATQLSTDGLTAFDPQSGNASVVVAGGQHFAFTMFSNDSFGGPATSTITGFNVSAVPEPDTLALMLAGLGVVGVAARRSRAGTKAC
jgi:hypothetical protein